MISDKLPLVLLYLPNFMKFGLTSLNLQFSYVLNEFLIIQKFSLK